MPNDSLPDAATPVNPPALLVVDPYEPRVMLQTAQRVWAAVTKSPQASIRELAATTGYHSCTVDKALLTLRDAGYIEFADRSVRARKIVVPCADPIAEGTS